MDAMVQSASLEDRVERLEAALRTAERERRELAAANCALGHRVGQLEAILITFRSVASIIPVRPDAIPDTR